MKIFSNEKTLPQHSVLSYQIDLYFPEHKLAIEVDEKVHEDRYIEKAIDKELGCEFIRINPVVKYYNQYAEIDKIYNHIIESTKKWTEGSTKESLIIFQKDY